MYETITKLANEFIKSIQNTGVFVVKSANKKADELKKILSSNTFSVMVKNPQKKVDVKGTVVVGNQSKLEKKIDKLEKAISKISDILPSLKEVEITNHKSFPKSVKVSNLSDKTRVQNLNVVVDALDEVKKVVSKLKLDPQIKVSAPKIPAPVVKIAKQPAPVVKIQEKEVDLSALNDLTDFWQSLTKSAKKSISVRLSDGKKFYKAMDKMIEVATANNSSHFRYYTGGEARPIVNKNDELQVTVNDTWEVNDTQRVSNVLTYFGEESVDEKWRVRKVTKSGTLTAIRHATIKNNSSIEGYDEAWVERTSLEYGLVREAL